MPKVVDIKLTDHSREVLEAMKEQVILGLKAVGAEAEGYAKAESPVDTGRLRNSICWAIKDESASGGGRDTPNSQPEENCVYIGTNVEYAPDQEYGSYHHKVGKAHFLRDSLSTHIERYKAIMEAALKD